MTKKTIGQNLRVSHRKDEPWMAKSMKAAFSAVESSGVVNMYTMKTCTTVIAILMMLDLPLVVLLLLVLVKFEAFLECTKSFSCCWVECARKCLGPYVRNIKKVSQSIYFVDFDEYSQSFGFILSNLLRASLPNFNVSCRLQEEKWAKTILSHKPIVRNLSCFLTGVDLSYFGSSKIARKCK